MDKLIKQFLSDEKGLELVEYALMLTLIVIGILVTVNLLAQRTNSRISQAASTIT